MSFANLQIKSIFLEGSQIAFKKKTIFTTFCPSAKIGKIVFFKCNLWQLPKKVWPNLKPYYERFFSEFYENGKQKLCSTKMTEQIEVFLSKFIFFNRKRQIILILVVFDHIILWASRSVTLLCAPACPLIILYIGTQYQSLSPKIYVLVVK